MIFRRFQVSQRKIGLHVSIPCHIRKIYDEKHVKNPKTNQKKILFIQNEVLRAV
jgi:hypothetical protein